MGILHQSHDLVTNPKHTKWLCPLLLVGDAILSILIVNFIPYTEIDWKTYMQQIAHFINGERNYYKISGDTGPLVYPAAHVYIYRALYAVTDRGQDIWLAQYMFIALYLATLGLVFQCYRAARVPPYVFPLLIASKRLHSIFMLRLFNDCWAVFFLFLAIYCWQRKAWTLGSFVFSFGVATKMSVLLALPGVSVMLWHALGRDRAFRMASIMVQIQVVLGFQFVTVSLKAYVSRAFELSRRFLFKWTVNWRFVGEELFSAPHFAFRLMCAHLLTLSVFMATRWLQPSKASIFDAVNQLFDPPPQDVQVMIARKITPRWIITTILSSLLIGCVYARSLHYQFYAYIAWSTPLLLWSSGLHPVLIYAIWAAQEWAWNVYPSTNESSMVVVGCLAVTVLSVWAGTREESVLADNKVEHQHKE